MAIISLNIMLKVDFFPLLVILFVAWLVPVVLNLIKIKRIPAPVLEMLFGFVLAWYLRDYVSEATFFSLDFLSLIGLIFIMFLSGLEIDVDQMIGALPAKKFRLKEMIYNPLFFGLIHFSGTLVLSLGLTFVLSLWFPIHHIWFFSLILTTTFLGLVLPVLKERGETASRFGQMVIISAAIADILGIILLTISAIFLRFGSSPEVLLILVLFLLFIVVYRLGTRFQMNLFKRITFQLSHAASQISIRGSMVLLLAFISVAQFMGQEGIFLGAFLSGLLLSVFLHKGRSLLLLKLDGMGYGFFIPIFFVMVGFKFEIHSLREFDSSLWIFLVLLTLVMFVVKLVPSLLWTRQFGLKRAVAGGFLMSARLGLVIAAASVGLELNAITPGINSSFIIMAMITCLISPILYDLIFKRRIFLEDKTVIVGGSSVGVLLARRMKMHGKSSVIIEKESGRFNDLNEKGLHVIHGDGEDVSVYESLQLTPGNTVVVLTGSDDVNLRICSLLRKELLHEKIISKPSTSRIEHHFRQLGVESIDSRRILATTIENLIFRPATYHALVDTFENYLVEEISVNNPAMSGKPLREVPLDRDCMLILISRGNTKDIPHGDTYLQTGDVITVFGTASALESIRRQVQA
jgi:Kef-type K+ transport system membrane component KefB/Trk K+ transport system NAD-binding subunit